MVNLKCSSSYLFSEMQFKFWIEKKDYSRFVHEIILVLWTMKLKPMLRFIFKTLLKFHFCLFWQTFLCTKKSQNQCFEFLIWLRYILYFFQILWKITHNIFVTFLIWKKKFCNTEILNRKFYVWIFFSSVSLMEKTQL